jgi:hypothetical protein
MSRSGLFGHKHNEIYDIINKMRGKTDSIFDYTCPQTENDPNFLNLTCLEGKILKMLLKIDLKRNKILINDNKLQSSILRTQLINIKAQLILLIKKLSVKNPEIKDVISKKTIAKNISTKISLGLLIVVLSIIFIIPGFLILYITDKDKYLDNLFIPIDYLVKKIIDMPDNTKELFKYSCILIVIIFDNIIVKIEKLHTKANPIDDCKTCIIDRKVCIDNCNIYDTKYCENVIDKCVTAPNKTECNFKQSVINKCEQCNLCKLNICDEKCKIYESHIADIKPIDVTKICVSNNTTTEIKKCKSYDYNIKTNLKYIYTYTRQDNIPDLIENYKDFLNNEEKEK